VPFLDTTVLVDLTGRSKGAHQAAARAVVRDHVSPTDLAATSRLNFAEMLFGVELAADPITERRKLDDVLQDVAILDFDDSAALRYAKIAAQLRRLGRSPGTMDMLVASVALGAGGVFITRNPKHFSDVPGLIVVTY
jgi:predicted nucleic acid-binding protein